MINKVILIGRLVRDPELRYTKSGTAVASFSLAVDKGLSREKRQEAEANNRPTAEFPRIVVLGRMAENASAYLSKGRSCAIEGRIQTGSYQDRETGKTIYTTDIVADRVEFLDSQNTSQDNAGATKGQNARNYISWGEKSNTGRNRDDFFEDDFEEVQDDGRIPF